MRSKADLLKEIGNLANPSRQLRSSDETVRNESQQMRSKHFDEEAAEAG
jgi:hypothetical protein